MFVTYGFDSSLKGIPSIFINILHDGFPGVKAHHLENFPLILRIVSVHPAADLHILPDQILVYICSSIENRQHQPHTKQQLYVWPEWKPDILYIYIYISHNWNMQFSQSLFNIFHKKKKASLPD